MTTHHVKRNTWFFIGFFILAGVAYLYTRVVPPFFDTLLSSANFVIYAALLIFWIRSVRSRLLPTKTRSCMIAAVIMMLTLLAMRIFKYRFGLLNVVISRYSVYAYFIPMVFIPALFLLGCIFLRRGERGRGKRSEAIVLLPAALLALMALTNDLHFMVYRPLVELSQFAVQGVATYSRGPGFYLIYAWMLLTGALGVVILLRETRKSPGPITAALVGIIICWITLCMIHLFVVEPNNYRRMWNTPEIHIFAMLAIMEVCIRSRLIPINENYIGIFTRLDLPVLVTDRSMETVYRSSVPVNASGEQLSASLSEPTYLTPDLRLSGMEIRAGYAFWTEDEGELHRKRRDLAQANEILSEENDLIAAENTLKEKKAHLDAQNQVYDRITEALFASQKKIEALLEQTDPSQPEFRNALARVCVWNAYSKRKSNLLLLSEDTLPQPNRELFLALQESARYLKYCGVETAAIGEETADFSLADIHELYDAFEVVIEAYLPHMRRMTVSLIEGGVRLALETEQDVELPYAGLPVERKKSDEYTFLTIRARRGGAAK